MGGRRTLVLGLAALGVGLLGLVLTETLAPGPLPATGAGWPGAWTHPLMTTMMGGPSVATARPIGIEAAAQAVQSYVTATGLPNLAVAEVMEFLNNYYAVVVERDTGRGAFELLVDKSTGLVFPEFGPTVVWNTRYGPAGGWASPTDPGAEMPIGPDQARALAAQYLDSHGLRRDLEPPVRFYGYYTFHTLRGQETDGMLSVNGFTGEVWYHAWHGPFIQKREFPLTGPGTR